MNVVYRFALVSIDSKPQVYFPDFKSMREIDERISPEPQAQEYLEELIHGKKELPPASHLIPFLTTVKRMLRFKGLDPNQHFIDHNVVTVNWEVT